MERLGDKKLYDPANKPGRGPRNTSPEENERVRALLIDHLSERVLPALSTGLANVWGIERGKFARDWIEVAQKIGLRQPGAEFQKPLAPPGVGRKRDRDPYERKLEAARTELRQFLEGEQLYEWQLVGIESTICDRAGLALPAKAYETQQQLKV